MIRWTALLLPIVFLAFGQHSNAQTAQDKLDIYSTTINYMVSYVPECKFDFIISDTLLIKFDSTAYKTWGSEADTIPTSRLFDTLFHSKNLKTIKAKSIIYKKDSNQFKYLSVSDCIFFNADEYTFALVQLRVSKKYNDKTARFYTYYLARPQGSTNWTIIRGK